MKAFVKPISLAALLVCTQACADDIKNLIPNGNFDDVSGSLSWSVGPTGTITFVPNKDAEGATSSGSLLIAETDGGAGASASTPCIPVKPGSSYEYGAKWSGADTGNWDQVNTDTRFTCASFSTTTCDSGATQLGGQIVHFDPPSNAAFTSYPTTQGVLGAAVRAVQCSAGVISDYHGFASSGILLDDVFFNAAPPDQSSVKLDGYMSGSWYNMQQSGQGFQLEFTDQNNALLAFWFVYGPDGGQRWIYAQGPYDSTTNVVTVWAYTLDGGKFPPLFDPSQLVLARWGLLTFDFTDCNNGTVTWNAGVAGYSSGSMPIQRLTSIRGTSCPH